MRFSLPILVFALITPSTSSAAGNCELVTDGPGIAQLLESKDVGAVMQCSGSHPDEHSFHILSNIREGIGRVCGYTAQAIHRDGDKWQWGPSKDQADHIPTWFMSPRGKQCPPLASPGYIPVTQISEGVFVKLLDFWSHVSRTPKSLRSAIEKAPGCSDPDIRCSDMWKSDTGPLKGWSAPKLVGMSYGNMTEKLPNLMLMLRESDFSGWLVVVDLIGSDVTVADVSYFVE